MEEVYLRGRANLPKAATWCSRKVTFKTHFSDYSRELNEVLKERKEAIFDIYKGIFPEYEGSPDELHKQCLELKREFKESAIDPESSKKSVPSTSKGHITSDTQIGLPSSSKANVCPKGKREEDTNFICNDNDSEEIPVLEKSNASVKKRRRRRRTKKKSVTMTETRMEPLSSPETTTDNSLKSPSGVKCFESSSGETSKEIQYNDGRIEKVAEEFTKFLKSAKKVKLKDPSVSRRFSNNLYPNSTTNEKLQGAQEEEIDKLRGTQDAVSPGCSTSLTQLELLGNPLEYIRKEMKEVMNRGTRIKKRSYNRRDVPVDTTKRLGRIDLTPWENFVVTFRVHKPFKHSPGDKGGRTGKFDAEIDVLNYQTLADLRKLIQCEADYQDVSGDVSNCLDKPKVLTKDEFKSGMFYVDNTFYVDTRPGAEDYSKVIKEWGRKRGIKLGNTVPMDSTSVEDFEVRLGYPYVYMHQGSCEHLIIINSARFLTPKDSLHSSDYPNLTKVSRSRMEYCCCCAKIPASWIVTNSDRMFHDINKMCDSCFRSYHYINNEKIGYFKAFRYTQRAVLFS